MRQFATTICLESWLLVVGGNAMGIERVPDILRCLQGSQHPALPPVPLDLDTLSLALPGQESVRQVSGGAVVPPAGQNTKGQSVQGNLYKAQTNHSPS